MSETITGLGPVTGRLSLAQSLGLKVLPVKRHTPDDEDVEEIDGERKRQRTESHLA